MTEVREHFNTIASEYDSWKKKNWYYYQNLMELVRRHVPADKTVLEIGTGTGDILASVGPQTGIGLDISQPMIELAQKKYQDRTCLKFYCCAPSELPVQVEYDHIILIDVVEHLEDIQGMARQINALSGAKTQVFISMANPLWEPILMLAEKLKLKMPEGKHYRLLAKKLISIFMANGFILQEHGFTLHLPKNLGLVSKILNLWLEKIPGLKRLGLIEYFVFVKA